MIRSEHDPVEPEGSLFILKGSLAPGGAVVKASGVAKAMWCGTLSARVFEDEESAIDARAPVRSRRVPAPSSAQRRNEGRSRHARDAGRHLNTHMGAGLGDTCALVTDRRFSGATHGPAIGYVTPEAARGGVIALVQDGDRIWIDLAQRKLDLLVEPAEIERRRAAYLAPEPGVKRGYLKFYADHVAPASEGAVLPR